ncbi:MAG: excinuclease ABC subunit UvrC [Gammaproteobacteria bacterium]
MTTQPSVEPPFDARRFLRSLTTQPGVYRMLGADGEVLYVGKAGNLKKRVSSYFQRNISSQKTRALVAQIRSVEVTVTHTEAEALILENNLIKALQPRYNILLRDDKSYPYIFLSTGEKYPRLSFHRGARREKGRYFGPYPNATAVRDSLHLMQKLFGVRQCDDHFFRNRSRPCLQYQIKRCSGPCVGMISEEQYAQDVAHTTLFLEGKNSEIVDELVGRMEAASQRLEFEEAARLRDQVQALRKVQERQYVSGERGDVDVVVALARSGVGCVHVLFIRQGRVLGNKSFFPKTPEQSDNAEMLSAFLSQHYIGRTVPDQIIISDPVADREVIEKVLSEQRGRHVQLTERVRGERARWQRMALTNAKQALASRIASRDDLRSRYLALQEALDLDECPERIECFDISHTMGEATVASCVVFGPEGALSSDYRRFNIRGDTGGDDYLALEEAVSRRYTRLQKGEGVLPDILLIDGGKGQVARVARVLEELQVTDPLLLGVAKGEGRRPGLERLFLSGQKAPIILPADSPALHLIQQIRDEAHRFAITGHRQRRSKNRRVSSLEQIEGLGPKRRQALLKHFGGLRGVTRAGVEDLARVSGISKALAQRVYDAFHLEEGQS